MGAKQHAIQTIEAMLAGTMSFLEGATVLSQLRFEIPGVSDSDADFIVFVGIDSETDHLPRDAQRAFWAPEALEKLALDLEEAEKWARKISIQECHNLLSRFKDA